MKTKSKVQAGSPGPFKGVYVNHNQTLRVRSRVKAGDSEGGRGGSFGFNHNQTLRVKSNLSAGDAGLIASQVHYSSRYNN